MRQLRHHRHGATPPGDRSSFEVEGISVAHDGGLRARTSRSVSTFLRDVQADCAPSRYIDTETEDDDPAQAEDLETSISREYLFWG